MATLAEKDKVRCYLVDGLKICFITIDSPPGSGEGISVTRSKRRGLSSNRNRWTVALPSNVRVSITRSLLSQPAITTFCCIPPSAVMLVLRKSVKIVCSSLWPATMRNSGSECVISRYSTVSAAGGCLSSMPPKEGLLKPPRPISGPRPGMLPPGKNDGLLRLSRDAFMISSGLSLADLSSSHMPEKSGCPPALS